jgi:hypothetical protein
MTSPAVLQKEGERSARAGSPVPLKQARSCFARSGMQSGVRGVAELFLGVLGLLIVAASSRHEQLEGFQVVVASVQERGWDRGRVSGRAAQTSLYAWAACACVTEASTWPHRCNARKTGVKPKKSGAFTSCSCRRTKGSTVPQAASVTASGRTVCRFSTRLFCRCPPV